MEQVIERPMAGMQQDSPTRVTEQGEVHRQAAVTTRRRNRRIQHVLDFAIIGTVGLLVATAGIMGLFGALSG
jgi:hypothetical protein